MSEYDYDDAPRRRRSHRSTREVREPEYVTETTYIQRGPGQPSRDLVYRGREDSIEDIERDFPPPGSDYRRRSSYRTDDYDQPPRRARSVGRRDRYDDDYSDYAGPAAGAAAGYAAGRSRRRRDDRDDGYYSDDYERPRTERRKSKAEDLLEGFGLGGIASALTGRSRSRSRAGRDRYGNDSDSDRSHKSTRSRGGGRDKSRDRRKKWQQAATAAVIAGATEAYRARKEPNKGTRIATAALASAGLDSFLDRNPDEHKKRHVLESVVGGLAANRLANGPRSQSRGRARSGSASPARSGIRGRSRSLFRSLSRGRARSNSGSPARSKSRSRGLKEVAAIGGVAAVGKAIYDRVRSKSRGRNRSRSRESSEDSYVPSRRQRYQTDRGRPAEDDDINDRGSNRGGSERGRGFNANGDGGSKKRGESSESISTTDLENQKKRSRTKELLTAAFATVATIHAGHGVFTSMQASEQRHKEVASGEITKEQARKQKSKNMLQDAAAVGIAALGIKGAFSEWKEMNETRHEIQELEDKRRRRRKRQAQRKKEQKQMMMHGGGGYGYGMPAYGYPGGPMPLYADSNPYSVSNQLPMPPMGAPPARY